MTKAKEMACAPGEDSDQPGHLPSLIRVLVVHPMGVLQVLSWACSNYT